MPPVSVEQPTGSDADALQELCRASVPESFRLLVEPHLRTALASDEEERLLIARDRAGHGAVTGFALYGIVPGTLGAGRVRGVAVTPLARRRGVGLALLQGACDDLRRLHARFVLVELPDDPRMRFFEALLIAGGFTEESRAADLVAPGVAMRYVRRDFPAA
jgi:predicted N-acetyltransferase YhbS